MTNQPTSGGTYTRDPVTGHLTPDVVAPAPETPESDPAPVAADDSPADPAPQTTTKKGGK